MTVGETISMLANAENYPQKRLTISDEFIGFIKQMMPSDYERIAKKEEDYIKMLELLKSLR